MLRSLADFYKTIIEDLPVDLIPASSLAQIYRTASFLPVLPSGGFECHLGRDQEHVDFWVVLERGKGSGLFPAKDQASDDLVSHLRSYPFWRRICRFYDRWMDPVDRDFKHIEALGFEFDVGRGTKELLIPSVFMSPYYAEIASGGGARTKAHIDRILGFISNFVDAITGEGLSPAVGTKLAHVLAALPIGSHVPYLGLMLARESPSIRFEIADLVGDQLREFLSQIYWPGSVKRLESVLTDFWAEIRGLRIAIDVAEVVHPGLGLIFEMSPQREGGMGLDALLERLVEAELCTIEQSRGLLTWPGCSYDRFEPETWSGEITDDLSPLGLVATNVLNRSINHIKVSITPNLWLNAKAYISYNVIWTGSEDPSRFRTLVSRIEKRGI